MPNPVSPRPKLTARNFGLLDISISGAFLQWKDATEHIKEMYNQIGLVDRQGHKRIARIVSLPAGTRLFKLTEYEEKWTRSQLSSWWSAVLPIYESDYGALELVQIAQDSGVPFRDLVRFISAVSIDWNALKYYVEIVLAREIEAYWGQFAPQPALQKEWPKDMKVSPHVHGEGHSIVYGDKHASYLPDFLGGYGAWQLYIPDFDKRLIDPSRILNRSATDIKDNIALLSYLRRSQQ